MSRRALFGILALAASLLVILGGCSLAASDGTGAITITASSGILTPSTPGTWIFDAGYVATNTIDSITFTVTNTTSQDFSATSSAYTNSDFSDSLQGSLTVPAGQSATFTGFFKPTYNPGSQETDALTLTPSVGSPIVLQLQGTSGSASFFQVLDGAGAPIINTTLNGGYGGNFITIKNPSRSVITFTANAIVSVSDTTDFTVDTSGTLLTLSAGGGTTTFDLISSAGSGATTAVTVTGQYAGAPFFFTFTFHANGS